MLPKNKLVLNCCNMGSDNKHEAQSPKMIDINALK